MCLFSAGLTVGDSNPGHAIAADLWRPAGHEISNGIPGGVCSIRDRLKDEDPLEVVDKLNSRATDISEPSQKSEQQYVKAIRSWLDSLDPVRRERARQIMQESHSDLYALRKAIRDKKQELASINFNKGMPPEKLPRLGMELQHLRTNLGQELRKVSDRLRDEAGIEVPVSDAQSYWFVPPQPE